jgi:hypothetical protein
MAGFTFVHKTDTASDHSRCSIPSELRDQAYCVLIIDFVIFVLVAEGAKKNSRVHGLPG